MGILSFAGGRFYCPPQSLLQAGDSTARRKQMHN
jgi:hypothetical protein